MAGTRAARAWVVVVEGVPEQMFDLVTFVLGLIEDSVTYILAVLRQKGWDTSKLLLERGAKLLLVAVVVRLLLVVPLALQERVVLDMERGGDLGAVCEFVERGLVIGRIKKLCDFAFSFRSGTMCTAPVGSLKNTVILLGSMTGWQKMQELFT